MMGVIRELREWLIVKSVAKKYKEELDKLGFRIDYIGRIYTVINFPDEYVNNQKAKEGYILEYLRSCDEVFIKMEIGDIVAPEFVTINDSAVLLIISPEREYLTLFGIGLFLLKLSLVGLVLNFLIKLIIKWWPNISEFFSYVV